jgi:hypothetical protein
MDTNFEVRIANKEMEEKSMISQIPLIWKIGAFFLCLVMVVTTITTIVLVVVITANGGVDYALKFIDNHIQQSRQWLDGAVQWSHDLLEKLIHTD